tara:strand:+ start:906 stop:1043 length:138 start_codon:yes stop_codon:yes gene_type:complete
MPNTAEMEEVINATIINMKVSIIENLGILLNYMCNKINFRETKAL